MGILSELKPYTVFRYFEEICSIPHGSTDTKKISDYCVSFAKEHNFHYIQDAFNNVMIFKAGTAGYENSKPVIIQGHLDMVCEKENGCAIDFETDGLNLDIRDGYVYAKGTTLGGDDGIAIAYALAVLASKDMAHPPIEAVFTVDEEIGMLGAAAIDCSSLKSDTMLNIDSEEEGYLLVSCAGGVTATCHLPVHYKEAEGNNSLSITVTGLEGGHSGTEIDKGRANANQVLGRILFAIKKEVDFYIADINGGLKDNAIPREASAKIVLHQTKKTDMGDRLQNEMQENSSDKINETDKENEAESNNKVGNEVNNEAESDNKAGNEVKNEAENKIIAIINKYNAILQNEYSLTDAGIRILLQKNDTKKNIQTSTDHNQTDHNKTENNELDNNKDSDDNNKIRVFDRATTDNVITALVNLPCGISKMSRDIEGLVQTSLNLGILKTGKKEAEAEVVFSYSVRSSVKSEKDELVARLECLMEALSGYVTCAGEYPAWEYKKDSRLRDLMVEVYEEQYGEKPVIQAIHAGVECGLFAGKIHNLDCVSFGPNILDIHTPKERLDIESVERVWQYLIEVLRRLK